ncbi:MAG: S8 family serine peptidase [Promethearchaeota archaeon]
MLWKKYKTLFKKYGKSLFLSVICFSIIFINGISSISPENFKYTKYQGGNASTYVDPALLEEIDSSPGNKIITTWFLFENNADKYSWMEENPTIKARNFDINTGLYITATVGDIKSILSRGSFNLVKSAWLEQEIDTGLTNNEYHQVPYKSTSPSSIPRDFLNMTKFRNETGLDGRGVIIGLLSTGVGIHDDLKYVYNETGDPVANKIIANVSFVDWDPLYVDIHGEGTYLAGILAGTGNSSNGTFTGIAPGAQIINAKCVDFIGITLWYWAVSALEFSISHGADIIVSGWNIIGYPGDPLTVAVEEITSRGVLVVSASGDLGPAYMTMNTPGMASSSITAGAIDTTSPGEITVANFSSRGPTLEFRSKPDVMAPGVNITSCLPNLNLSDLTGYGELPINLTARYGDPLPSNPEYTVKDTTAASAAFVGGISALLLQNFQFARPETIKDALARTAVDLGLDSCIQGSGIVNVSKAMDYLAEHASPMPESRSYTPAQVYAGFVPNYELSATENKTSLYFVSNYGTVNYYTYLVQNLTATQERNVTHLFQGMFGLYIDGQFTFFMMDEVLREMHLTHYGNYSRAFSILNHQDELLVIITAETWRESMQTMRLRFDIINMDNVSHHNVSLHTWWKVDLDLLTDMETMAQDDEGGYINSSDILYVNDTTKGPQNESFFMFKASQRSDGHAVGGLGDTMGWIQDDNVTFTGSNPVNDSLDNVTLAAKYNLTSELAPGARTGLNISMGCGFNFTTLQNETNTTLSGRPDPSIRDIVVVESNLDRMYQVQKIIETDCMVINTGNEIVNDTQLIFASTRVLNESTETMTQTWNLGNVAPLVPIRMGTTWSPTYESMYSCSWMSADQDTIQQLLFNLGNLTDLNFSDINLPEFDPSEINWTDLAWMNGSIGDMLVGGLAEDNPLDNLLMRDVFVYDESRMYIHANVLPEDNGLQVPRPYAGFMPRDPVTASVKPEYIGDFEILNLTLYSTVPLTHFNYTVSGNGSVLILEDATDLTSALVPAEPIPSPAIEVIGSSNVSVGVNESVNIRFWAEDFKTSNITRWELKLNGSVVGSGKPNQTFVSFSYMNNGTLAAGMYSLTATAWDNASNSQSITVDLTVGTSVDLAPSVGKLGYDYPLNDEMNVSLWFWIDDGASGNISSWELFLDGNRVLNGSVNGSYQEIHFDNNNTFLTSGSRNFTIHAVDNNSNEVWFEYIAEIEDLNPDDIPRTTGYTLFIFIDATFLKFPMAGNYITTINFTSDQGFIDTIIINYTIEHPRAKILFDTQHNDLLNILTGDQRDMLMGSYNELYEVLKADDYDMDEYIVFSNYTSMVMEGMSLFEFYDAIVIADPEYSFSPEEIELLKNYTNDGGKLIILADADGGTSAFGSADLLSGGGSGDSLGGLGGMDLGMDFEFDFDFDAIRDLLSGAGNMPDGCNITGLNELVSEFGFQFNVSTTNATDITNLNASHPILHDFGSGVMHLEGYTSFNIVSNQSMNTPLAYDAEGNLVAAIHENPSTGGMVVLLSDSNLADAYNIHSKNNSEILTHVFEYLLRNELSVQVNTSRSQIHMGENLYLNAIANASEGFDPESLLGIVAFVHIETGEMVLSQFLPTHDNYYASFLISDGLDLMGYYFPPLNHTGQYYALAFFNDPSVTGAFYQVEFEVLPRLNETGNEFRAPDLNTLFEGLIITTVTMTLVTLIYFNARRKQEESMSVPELDEKMVRDIDNVLMELQSKLTVLSEEIMYRKAEDYKLRLNNLEDRISSFMNSVKKMRRYKKKMSKF